MHAQQELFDQRVDWTHKCWAGSSVSEEQRVSTWRAPMNNDNRHSFVYRKRFAKREYCNRLKSTNQYLFFLSLSYRHAFRVRLHMLGYCFTFIDLVQAKKDPHGSETTQKATAFYVGCPLAFAHRAALTFEHTPHAASCAPASSITYNRMVPCVFQN